MSDEEDETVDEIAYKLNDEDATECEQALLSNTFLTAYTEEWSLL